MLKCSDIIQMIRETLELEIGGAIGTGGNGKTTTKGEYSSSEDGERPVKRGKKGKEAKKQVKEEVEIKEEEGPKSDYKFVENAVREGDFSKLKVADLKSYLKLKGLHTTGNK